jgi:hypothetical protein
MRTYKQQQFRDELSPRMPLDSPPVSAEETCYEGFGGSPLSTVKMSRQSRQRRI